MLSVTQRIKQVSQPYGGYLPVSLLRVYSFDDQKQIDESDYLTDYSGLQGLTVDYLTRFMSGYPIEKAFEISFEGAEIVGQEAQAHRFARKTYKLWRRRLSYRRRTLGFQNIKE